MTREVWKPAVTVAAVIERDGRFLLVEEETADGRRINQPAGHWEEGETLVAACARETLEETAWRFEPRALIGVYRWRAPGERITYLRFAFRGDLLGHEPQHALDRAVVRTLWLTPEEIRARRSQHRSPLVLRCVEDYLAGRRYPLDMLVWCE